ncbi:MAG TPA: hypothetical protein VHI71_07620 [Actinomycetota bacterium]|nr:hypothetical protein [Actinomycetota bacterium]
MKAQAAQALPAAPDVNLIVVGPAAEARARAALKRFEEAIQSFLDSPLDAAMVAEWTRLRSIRAL